jgi:hypothetical protein
MILNLFSIKFMSFISKILDDKVRIYRLIFFIINLEFYV